MENPHRPNDVRSIRRGLAERIRTLAREEFGEDGSRRLAALLGLPPRTLRNFEAGCTIPSEMILAIIHITGVHPNWLLTGLEPMFLPPVARHSNGTRHVSSPSRRHAVRACPHTTIA